MKKELYHGKSPLVEPTGAFNKVELTAIDPVTTKLSACCKPNPTDKRLFALLSERGLSVHNKDCPKLKKVRIQREDIVDLRWKLRKTAVVKPQSLVVMAAARQRIMMMLGVAPDEMKILDLMILSKTPTPTPAWEVTFQVRTLYVLRKVLRHLEKSGLPYEYDFDY